MQTGPYRFIRESGVGRGEWTQDAVVETSINKKVRKISKWIKHYNWPISILFPSAFSIFYSYWSCLGSKYEIKFLSLWLSLFTVSSAYRILPFLPIGWLIHSYLLNFSLNIISSKKHSLIPKPTLIHLLQVPTALSCFETLNTLVINYSVTEFPERKSVRAWNISTLLTMMSSAPRKCLEWCLTFSGWT